MSRPLILDPQAVPVIATDAHLAPVHADRLLPAALRARFRAPPPWQLEHPGDGSLFNRAPAAASVLVPLVDHGDRLTVLLTRRTDHLTDHAGQISFPGGRSELHDADAVETALREAEEEVGLAREHVEVIGSLPIYTTITAFHVTPVVALVRPGFSLQIDPFEVDEAFEVPLDFLMTPAHHHRHEVDIQGLRRQFLSMPWHDPLAPDNPARRYFIWGATAAMLRNFYRFLSA
jgi:8-oxo-dGTP pyrophosphatase MutT (NUDIX family)